MKEVFFGGNIVPCDNIVARRWSWVVSPPTRWRRLKRFTLRIVHHRLPRILNADLSFIGIARSLSYAILIAVISLAPHWADWWDKGQISIPQAWWMSAIIVALLVTKHLFDSFGKDRQLRSAQRDLMAQCATRHQVINSELFGAMPENLRIDPHKRIDLCKKILACMRYIAKLHADSHEGDYFQVTLMTFADEGCTSIRVIARAKDDRATGTLVRSQETIAYYVAMSGAAFTVDDMCAQVLFDHAGLSDKILKYRSILLIPLIHRNANEKCCGIVTVDSSRPYEFTGSVGDAIIAQLMPFTSVLALLVEKEAHCMRIGS